MLSLLAWAERFVATPSVSSDGNIEIAARACELLGEIGIAARREEARHDGVQHQTVIADLGPRDAPDGLLLVTHLDTVPAGNPETWTATGGDPWKPTRNGNRLYGLGSADAKVDLVCKAAALAELDLSRLRRPVRVIGTFGEEIGLVGARWLIDQGLTEGFRYALVGEPSELFAIHAHKGRRVYEARIPLEPLPSTAGRVAPESFRGRSAHSSTPELGENAIDAALARLAREDVLGLVELAGGEATNKIPERCELSVLVGGDESGETAPAWDATPLLRFHAAWRELLAELRDRRDPSFDPDHSVGNLACARRRDGTVVLEFDLRPIPSVDGARAAAKLGEWAELECLRVNPALETPLDSPLVRAVVAAQESLGLGARLATKATCTEAGVLSDAGLDAVVIGAGTSVGNVHRPNEYTRIDELHTARDLYREVIHSLCVEDAASCSC
ncbi:MAG: M20/M25/M40 family metallo-hydrolase [Myxococcota bacterium]